ncbi:MAG: dihydrofolate reductase family protein [Minisyncoccia bacterium]
MHTPLLKRSALTPTLRSCFKGKIDFKDAFSKLKGERSIEKLTIQSGGTLNATLIREGLIDRVLLVVAPVLVGGKNTPSMFDGESLHTPEQLSQLKTLELVEARPLKDSYLRLEYKVRRMK